MFAVLERNHYGLVVQFTGADLKEWYQLEGERHVFFCHVITHMVQKLVQTHRAFHPNAEQVIGFMKDAVPERFRVAPKYVCARAIESYMKSKYIVQYANRRTRKNLLARVPDDFVFTIDMR